MNNKLKRMGEIVQAVLQQASGHEVLIKEIPRSNGIKHGVLIHEDGANIVPVVYLEDWYDRYERGEDVIGLCMEMLDIYKDGKEMAVHSGYHQMLLDYETVKNNICFRIVGENFCNIENVMHDRFLDLYVIYYVLLDKNQNLATTNVNQQLLETWGVSEEDIREAAKKNTERLFPGRITKFGPLSIASTDSGMFGASAMLYKNTIQNYANKIESDLYILPSSIHELILEPVADGADYPEFFKDMISDVNTNEVEPGIKLSDNLYKYRRATKSIELV